ncbi:hypothetical protein SMD_3624 [Stenotrophomonas maltophilia D457]|nr:hypothetical protein SMD_3624 [Stenotrophomonas maltophilia D457]
MPASGRHYRASAQRFGHRAEDQLHICSGWNRQWTPCHASPGNLPNGSAGRWPATALIPPHRDAGQRPALPGISPALRPPRGRPAAYLQRLEQAVDALPRFPWETNGR